MNPDAIYPAKSRLKRARAAVDALMATKDLSVGQACWVDFLLASNGVYAKLEQGAKFNGKSKAWFGRVKAFRKSDELLNYCHQARNADEHGLSPSLNIPAPVLRWVSPDYQIPPERKGKEFVIRSPDRRVNLTSTFPETPRLLGVTNFGVYYEVPSFHLGQRLTDSTIDKVMVMVCDYLEGLITEAESLVQKR